MSVPELVRERLGDEEPNERVALSGDDELVVTPTRTLIYRSEGLLSGETIEEYPHEVEQVAVSEGRRRTKVHLDHGLNGDSQFSVPAKQTDEALRPVLGGILAAAGVTEPGEQVQALYRLGELTIIITDARVIKHIGNAIWDEEYEEFAYEDVTRLGIEQGDVSSQVIIEVNGRPERIKTPSDDARAIREQVEQHLLAYHEVGSYGEFRDQVTPDEEDEGTEESVTESMDDDAESEADLTDEAFDDSGLIFGAGGTSSQSASEVAIEADSDDLSAELTSLREAVERQNDVLESQQQTIEQLIKELRRAR